MGPSSSFVADLTGQVAVVTGGAKGLGATLSRRFAEAGAAVLITRSNKNYSRRRISSVLFKTSSNEDHFHGDPEPDGAVASDSNGSSRVLKMLVRLLPSTASTLLYL
mgnify:CR=1 FL=1